jgi:hypothetical protein
MTFRGFPKANCPTMSIFRSTEADHGHSPRATAISGLGWVVSRALFAYGYITSEKPNGRGRYLGVTYYGFQLAVWGMALAVGGKLITGSL